MKRLTTFLSFWLMLCCVFASQAQGLSRGGREAHKEPQQVRWAKNDVRGELTHHVVEAVGVSHETNQLPPPFQVPTPDEVCVFPVPPPLE